MLFSNPQSLKCNPFLNPQSPKSSLSIFNLSISKSPPCPSSSSGLFLSLSSAPSFSNPSPKPLEPFSPFPLPPPTISPTPNLHNLSATPTTTLTLTLSSGSTGPASAATYPPTISVIGSASAAGSPSTASTVPSPFSISETTPVSSRYGSARACVFFSFSCFVNCVQILGYNATWWVSWCAFDYQWLETRVCNRSRRHCSVSAKRFYQQENENWLHRGNIFIMYN